MAGTQGWQKWKWVLFFLLPSAAGLAVFVIYPIFSSLWYALHRWNLLTPPVYVGLANFGELMGDADFWNAVRYTLLMIALYLPAVFGLGLVLALYLNQQFRGKILARTVSFLPVVASWVVVSIIWKWLFNPAYGLINWGLGLAGIAGPAWLYEPTTAAIAIVLTSIWKDVGYIALLFLGGLQGISTTYYEAARIDGAGRGRIVRSITLPLLTPTMFFVLITLLINYFQMFEQVWLMPMPDSAADRQVEVIVTEVVQNAFSYGRMGYASAMSWALFLIIFVITFIQLRLQDRWVYYEAE
ncbi:MAG: sugar ABC transporter permease [Caldilineaceae bacterium]|nr:sugar ABC transporter permease [Caldilineaceae bacterium]MCB9138037.1 sugar ABC transporter permease [Caldilineaceae bacterium]